MTDATSVTVVVRGSGERTLARCHELSVAQVGQQHTTIIQAAPFTEAMRVGYRMGLERGTKWTIALDADVLILPDAIQRLTDLAETMPDQAYGISGRVIDKLVAGPRNVGLHCFRTDLFPKALALIPLPEASVRPERQTKRRMADLGHPWVQVEDVLGVHDFAQYYRDLYRKARVHVKKHSRHIQYMQSLWQRLAREDFDYQVALWGLEDGLAFSGSIVQDSRQFPQLDAGRLQQAQQTEKAPLQAAWSSDELAAFVATFEPPPEYFAMTQHVKPIDQSEAIRHDGQALQRRWWHPFRRLLRL